MPKYFGIVMTNPKKEFGIMMTNPKKEFRDKQEHSYTERELMVKLLKDNSHDPRLAVKFLQELKCRDES